MSNDKVIPETNNIIADMQIHIDKAQRELQDLMEVLFDDDSIRHALDKNDYVQAEWLIAEKAPLQRADAQLDKVSELIECLYSEINS